LHGRCTVERRDGYVYCFDRIRQQLQCHLPQRLYQGRVGDQLLRWYADSHPVLLA
jgi:hypothetical protein